MSEKPKEIMLEGMLIHLEKTWKSKKIELDKHINRHLSNRKRKVGRKKKNKSEDED